MAKVLKILTASAYFWINLTMRLLSELIFMIDALS